MFHLFGDELEQIGEVNFFYTRKITGPEAKILIGFEIKCEPKYYNALNEFMKNKGKLCVITSKIYRK